MEPVRNLHPGATLIELVIYVAILGFLTAVIVNSLLVMPDVLGTIRATRTLSGTAAVAMERMLRTIRDAETVDLAASTLDTSPGVLSLTGSEATPLTHRLFVEGGALKLSQGTAAAIALTPSGVTVSNLIFRRIPAGTTSEAVRVELSLSVPSGGTTKTQNFYGTVTLRNSYDD